MCYSLSQNMCIQLLKKDFFLKPSYLSLLEAVCSVSDGQAVPQQQIRVFEMFVQKHKNLLFQLRLAPRQPSDMKDIRSLSEENFFLDLESREKDFDSSKVNLPSPWMTHRDTHTHTHTHTHTQTHTHIHIHMRIKRDDTCI